MTKQRATKKSSPPVKKEVSDDGQASSVLSLMTWRSKSCKDEESKKDAQEALTRYRSLSSEDKRKFVAAIAALPKGTGRSKVRFGVIMQETVTTSLKEESGDNVRWSTPGQVLAHNGYRLSDFPTREEALEFVKEEVQKNQALHHNEGRISENPNPLLTKYYYVSDLGSTKTHTNEWQESLSKKNEDLKSVQSMLSEDTTNGGASDSKSEWSQFNSTHSSLQKLSRDMGSALATGQVLQLRLKNSEDPLLKSKGSDVEAKISHLSEACEKVAATLESASKTKADTPNLTSHINTLKEVLTDAESHSTAFSKYISKLQALIEL